MFIHLDIIKQTLGSKCSVAQYIYIYNSGETAAWETLLRAENPFFLLGKTPEFTLPRLQASAILLSAVDVTKITFF